MPGSKLRSELTDLYLERTDHMNPRDVIIALLNWLPVEEIEQQLGQYWGIELYDEDEDDYLYVQEHQCEGDPDYEHPRCMECRALRGDFHEDNCIYINE